MSWMKAQDEPRIRKGETLVTGSSATSLIIYFTFITTAIFISAVNHPHFSNGVILTEWTTGSCSVEEIYT